MNGAGVRLLFLLRLLPSPLDSRHGHPYTQQVVGDIESMVNAEYFIFYVRKFVRHIK